MDLNKVMIIGRLTRNPETRTTPSGTNVCTFSVATGFTWKDQSGQKQEKTEFHNVVAWRKLGEICAQYLVKGKQVYIEGRLQTHSWDDPKGGKKYKTEIIADDMIMLGSAGGGGQGGNRPPVASAARFDAMQNKPFDAEPQHIPEAPIADDEIKVENIPF